MDTLLKMSVSGGILILLGAAARLLSAGRLPKRYFMMVWGVALVRLLVPVDLPFRFDITNPLTEAAGQELSAGLAAKSTVLLRAAKAAAGGTVPSGSLLHPEYALSGLWAIGVCVLAAVFTVVYIREARRLGEAIPMDEETARRLRAEAPIPDRVKLLVLDRISTPLVFGIVKQRIIIPGFLLTENSGRMKYVIAHEAVHLRRADNLKKVLMLAAVCIHWFNPAVWLLYTLFTRDMEMSCDEKVLALFGEASKKEYARALVGLVQKQYQWSLFSQGFGKSAVKERIEAIMKFKKATILSAACAVLLLGMTVTVFAQTEVRDDGGMEKDATYAQASEDVISESTEKAAGTAEENMEGTDTLADFLQSEEFKQCEEYGLSYDSETSSLMYEGEKIGYLYVGDEAGEQEGLAYITVFSADDAEEMVGISAIKDENGKISGLTKVKGPSVSIAYVDEEGSAE